MTVHREATPFTLTYRVTRDIPAAPARVWSLLTALSDIPSWNGAVDGLVGEAVVGARLRLTVPDAPGRTFRPTVVALEPGRAMTWADGFAPMFRGVRTFQVTPHGDGARFEMTERFSGLMMPLIRPSLPDFTAAFATWADDLSAAATR